MSSKALPEELLHEILAYHLEVSWTDRLFAYDPFEKPQRTPRKPSSRNPHHVLRVCKRWLRVGTPLLYRALYMASPNHVDRIAEVFALSPMLAKKVDRVWFALDACTPSLHKVMQQVPNTTELVVWLHYSGPSSWDPDPPVEFESNYLLHAMTAVCPRTLFLGGPVYRSPPRALRRRRRSPSRDPQLDVAREAVDTIKAVLSGPWGYILNEVHLCCASFHDITIQAIDRLVDGSGPRKVSIRAPEALRFLHILANKKRHPIDFLRMGDHLGLGPRELCICTMACDSPKTHWLPEDAPPEWHEYPEVFKITFCETTPGVRCCKCDIIESEYDDRTVQFSPFWLNVGEDESPDET